MSWARLSFRLQRWEIVFLTAGVALLAGAMLWYAWQLIAVVAENPGCDPSAFTSGCEAVARRYDEMRDFVTQFTNLTWAAPFGIGVVLGVPLVAREIDHGTTQVAWTLSRSRIQWLAGRLVFPTLVVIGLLVALAITGEILAAALFPQANLSEDFTWYGRRGSLLVARGLVALGVSVLVGAILGRLLPALLAAGFVTGIAFGGLTFGMDRWNEAEAVALPYGRDITGDLSLGERVVMTNGEVMTHLEMQRAGVASYAIGIDGRIYVPPDGAVDFEGIDSPADVGELIGQSHVLVIPAERYPEIVAREAAVLGGVAVLLGLGSGVVVHRRRPA
jgi:hypothetical protein